MIGIRKEIAEVETEAQTADNVLKNAPHTAQQVIVGCNGTALLAGAGRISGPVDARIQILAGCFSNRQCLRRPESNVFLSSDGGVLRAE